jgi:hypothetical protein
MSETGLIGAYRQMALVETYVDVDGVIKVRDSFRITPSFGAVYYQSVDMGFPDVRASVQDNPQSDGTYDETRYIGARSVSISGVALNNAFGDDPAQSGWDPRVGWNSASWFCRYLSAWASPARRYRLYFTDDSELPRYLDVRGDSFSAPVEKTSEYYRSWQLGLVNPSGKIYSFDTGPGSTSDGRTLQRIRKADINTLGRSYPEIGPYNRSYPVVVGKTALNYGGSVSNGFQARINTLAATMTDPRITVTSPDLSRQSIGITGYTVPAYAMMVIDTIERTVTVNGVNVSQYLQAPLQWPRLSPGITTSTTGRGYNSISFTYSSGAPNAYVDIVYNNADLL